MFTQEEAIPKTDLIFTSYYRKLFVNVCVRTFLVNDKAYVFIYALEKGQPELTYDNPG